MRNYIKILFRGTVYGPIEAPAPFHVICKHMKVSLKASPSLFSVQDPQCVIVDRNCLVPTGFYELLAVPNIKYEHVEEDTQRVVKHISTSSTETQTERTVALQRNIGSSSLPLGKTEMDIVMQGMMHLISSIPPRYIKYNKALGLQIKTSFEHVDSWTMKLDELYKEMNSSKTRMHPSGVEYKTFLTFTQYRILQLLYEVWKKVWQRFAPLKRVFNVSKIHTLHKLDEAEHILNCLHSWRRILDSQSWSKIQKYVTSMEVVTLKPLTSKELFLMPPRLPGDENAGDLVQLASDRPDLSLISEQQLLTDFRIEYLQKVSKDCLYKPKDLLYLMDKMVDEKAMDIPSFPTKAARVMIHQEMRI